MARGIRRNGKTLGKMVLNGEVDDDESTPVNSRRSRTCAGTRARREAGLGKQTQN